MTEIEQVPPQMLWENGDKNMVHSENEADDDWEGGNNSAKLFERSRIKALAGWLSWLSFAYDLVYF